jgi:hypothetical protein
MKLRLLAGLVAVVACHDATAPVAAPTLPGVWALASVNGHALPFTVDSNDVGYIVLNDDSFTFKSDSTFTEVADYQAHINGVDAGEQGVWPGSYSVQGDAVVLEYQNGAVQTMLWQGELLAETGVAPDGVHGVAYIYRKKS